MDKSTRDLIAIGVESVWGSSYLCTRPREVTFSDQTGVMRHLSQLGWLKVKVHFKIAKLSSIVLLDFLWEVVRRRLTWLFTWDSCGIFPTLADLHEFLNTQLLKQLSLLVMSLVQKSSQPGKQRKANGGKQEHTSFGFLSHNQTDVTVARKDRFYH